MKPRGTIRLVLPDLEKLCKEYISQREIKNHDQADFLILELIDQCVRTQAGGFLDSYYGYLKSNPEKHAPMIEYVRFRTGENLKLDTFDTNNSLSSKILKKLKDPIDLVMSIERKLSSVWIRVVSLLMPSAFREQNISFASIGEKHAWMWDFYTLSCQLENAGFKNIERLNFNTTHILGFPLIPLDIDNENIPRKGEGSMYIEATK
ncbi:hypothetical protein DO97_08160 [Neosynechococcus sphagnicola sy1]|uniref:Uncharacterized protein n=1 Tax=Neosynechococcus sphagnicola sy1 TaxID=1497020 RepID=A0A098TKY9_9CYAN|nr:hypothetical protein DO97_08160 [Neosynechococcus sphagnicola sy1]